MVYKHFGFKALCVISLALVSLYSVGSLVANADDSTSTPVVATDTPPVVSIGVGNGNTPANQGPVDGGVYHGDIPVYATVSDSDLETYHFRVTLANGEQGDTCSVPGSLFDPANQGYASTTLGKTACGFVFNQSVYYGPTGFTNTLIATLNTTDLAAFGGEGDYWLVLGALDSAGNRTNPDYTTDPKITITIDNTPPVTTLSTPITLGATTSDPIVLNATSTDLHGVASTTLSFADFDGTSCGAFSPITTITNSTTTSPFTSQYSWTPTDSGNYCVGAFSEDVPGNIENQTAVITNLSYQAPAATSTTDDSGTQSGGGSGGSGGSSGSSGPSGGGGNFGGTIGGPISSTTAPAPSSNVLADNGFVYPDNYLPSTNGSDDSVTGVSTATTSDSSDGTATSTDETATSTASTTTDTSNLAAAAASGITWSFWLLILIILLIALALYFIWQRMRRNR